MEIRRYRDGDLRSLAKLMVTAFGAGDAWAEAYFDPEKNKRLDPDGVLVIEEDEGPRATATVLPLEVFVDGEPHPMGGVAAVTAHPAYRRRGHAGALMREILNDLRERGVHLSMLWPFAHAFYRVYGYELAAEDVLYSLKPSDLPTSPEQKYTRAYRDGDLPAMMTLHEAQSAQHQCCVRRSEDYWRTEGFWRDGGGERSAVVYEQDGAIEGYLLYRMSGWRDGPGAARELRAEEFVADTRRAREGLVSFLAALDPLVFEIKHCTPRGEPLHPFLSSSHVKIEVEPEFMLRLVDVEGALGHLRRAIGEPLALEVSDDVIPVNSGEYTVGDGGVRRGAHSEHRATLDVRQLAQLYAGYLPARLLVERGLVGISSGGALELLEAMFPAGDPWVFGPDHF